MAQVTDEWSAEERETFTELLVRFNEGLADWHAGLSHRDELPEGDAESASGVEGTERASEGA